MDGSELLVCGRAVGGTNPFIKRAQAISRSKGVVAGGDDNKPSTTSPSTSIFRLLTDTYALIPYGINQCGSILFFILLSKEPVSQATPICNSLTFVFTAFTGYYFCGEKVGNTTYLFLGIGLVLLGTYICLLS